MAAVPAKDARLQDPRSKRRMNWMAEAAAAGDPMIPGAWLTTFVVAVIGAVGMAWQRMAGRKDGETSREVTLKKPVPKVTVKEDPDFVTRDEMKEHLERIEGGFTEVKRMIENDRGTARTSIGNIHKRIDSMSESLGGRVAAVGAKIDEVGKNVGLLLEVQIHKTGRTGKQ